MTDPADPLALLREAITEWPRHGKGGDLPIAAQAQDFVRRVDAGEVRVTAIRRIHDAAASVLLSYVWVRNDPDLRVFDRACDLVAEARDDEAGQVALARWIGKALKPADPYEPGRPDPLTPPPGPKPCPVKGCEETAAHVHPLPGEDPELYRCPSCARLVSHAPLCPEGGSLRHLVGPSAIRTDPKPVDMAKLRAVAANPVALATGRAIFTAGIVGPLGRMFRAELDRQMAEAQAAAEDMAKTAAAVEDVVTRPGPDASLLRVLGARLRQSDLLAEAGTWKPGAAAAAGLTVAAGATSVIRSALQEAMASERKRAAEEAVGHAARYPLGFRLRCWCAMAIRRALPPGVYWSLAEMRRSLRARLSSLAHNVVAHPLLELWPRVGERLHDATEPRGPRDFAADDAEVERMVGVDPVGNASDGAVVIGTRNRTTGDIRIHTAVSGFSPPPSYDAIRRRADRLAAEEAALARVQRDRHDRG